MSLFRDHYDWVVLGDNPGALLSASLAANLGLSALILPISSGLTSGTKLTWLNSSQCFDHESSFLLGLGNIGEKNGLLAEILFQLRKSLPAGATDETTEQALQPSQNESFRDDRDEIRSLQVLTPKVRFQLLDNKYFSNTGLPYNYNDFLLYEIKREFGVSLHSNDIKGTNYILALEQFENSLDTYWHALIKHAFPEPPPGEHQQNNRKVSKIPIKLDPIDLTSNQVSQVSWLKRNAHTRLSEVEKSTKISGLRELFSGIWQGASISTTTLPHDPTVSEALHVFAMLKTGARAQGCLTQYREFLLKLAKSFGVHVPEETQCRRIFLERGKLAGIQATTSGNMISVGGGALGCSLTQAKNFVTESGSKLFQHFKESPKPSGWKFTISVEVNNEAILPGISPNCIWQEIGAPTLEIEISKPEDYGLKHRDSSIIHLRTILPFTEETLENNYLLDMASRMFRQLTEIIPFLEFHVINLVPDFRRKNSREESFLLLKEQLELLYPFKTLDSIPENLRSFSGEGVGITSGINNLYCISNESYPELGSLGGTVAALQSVDHFFTKWSEKKD